MPREESNITGREGLRMKKAGIIPRRVWNALVDLVWSGQVTSVVGGRLKRSKNGTVIEVPQRGWPAAESHPFRLMARQDGSSCRCDVWWGAFTHVAWWLDGTTPVAYTSKDLDVPIGAADANGGFRPPGRVPGAIEPGKLTLAANATHGIWLVADQGAGATGAVTTPHDGTLYSWAFDATVYVTSSTTATTEADAPTLSGHSGAFEGYAVWFIGSVTVDAAGVPTGVVQFRRSDVTFVAPMWVAPVVVSADASNSISAGSDGGAYYDAP